MPAADLIAPIIFFGTPDFAVPTLAALVAAGQTPVLVVTQPSRPVGRGRQAQDPPVARWAHAHGLAVAQPERVRAEDFLATLRALVPGVAVVVAFGQIFPRDLLAVPRFGCINLHASLLPRWRGAAPIQAAVAAGEERTGVTTMQMEAGLDSGPILLQEEVAIGAAETAGELSVRLAETGAALVVRTLDELARGGLAPRTQDAALATYAPRLTRDSGRAGWSLSAKALADLLRAYTPWPGLTAELAGAPVKLVRARVLAAAGEEAAPGTFLGLRGGALAVACGGGSVLAVEELQRPGRKPLRAADFANGERLRAGDPFS
ncbi:MAG TPA: methionyl-tRNA formyltransferase [Thermoanaerobaculia bacterium]